MNPYSDVTKCLDRHDAMKVKLDALKNAFTKENMEVSGDTLASFYPISPVPELMGWNWSKKFDDSDIA